MAKVNVSYSDFLDGNVERINFDLLQDKILSLKYNDKDSTMAIAITDKITANLELSGALDYDGVNTLIKALSIIRNRMKISENVS